jgi:mannitol/fructose-specific phosphotransferase system IIA component (Ntr-type)
MGITDHLSAADIILDLDATTKAAALQRLAAEAADRLGRPEEEVLEAIQARERLGSTALGRGVALPHARLEGDPHPVVLLARLRRPVEFDARDEEPVDLVILVRWPKPRQRASCRCSRRPAGHCGSRRPSDGCARQRRRRRWWRCWAPRPRRGRCDAARRHHAAGFRDPWQEAEVRRQGAGPDLRAISSRHIPEGQPMKRARLSPMRSAD